MSAENAMTSPSYKHHCIVNIVTELIMARGCVVCVTSLLRDCMYTMAFSSFLVILVYCTNLYACLKPVNKRDENDRRVYRCLACPWYVAVRL